MIFKNFKYFFSFAMIFLNIATLGTESFKTILLLQIMSELFYKCNNYFYLGGRLIGTVIGKLWEWNFKTVLLQNIFEFWISSELSSRFLSYKYWYGLLELSISDIYGISSKISNSPFILYGAVYRKFNYLENY